MSYRRTRYFFNDGKEEIYILEFPSGFVSSEFAKFFMAPIVLL
jgi:hypothetical protein